MSEFDKEAEREKLREKYGEDDADREATQRMSQLLLQGATMTNRHCDRCGDPIFRQNGQEFCPTCNAEAQAGDAEVPSDDAETRGSDADAQPAGADGQPADADAGAATPEEQSATADRQSPDADDATPATANAPDAADDRPTAAANDRTTASERDGLDRVPSPSDGAVRSSGSSSASRGGVTDTSDRQSSASAGDLADADAALVQTLNRFASAAAQTDDPRRAKENLEAAREAAEALDALRR